MMRIERKKKVEPEKTVTKELRQTTLWQCLEVKKQGQVGDGVITGQVAGELGVGDDKGELVDNLLGDVDVSVSPERGEPV